MKPLTIYWNELSLPNNVVQADLGENGIWAERARNVIQALHNVWRVQPRAKVSLSKGQLHAYILGQPIFSWLELWLGRDQVRRLKGLRLIQTEDVEALLHEFDCEVRLAGVLGDGLTRAHIAETWVWSLGNANTDTDGKTITARVNKLDDQGVINSQDVLIPNLAEIAHSTYWENRLAAWGQNESTNCVIGTVAGYAVLMYPFDHGYPHVHVKVADQPQCVFKYRVDTFKPLASSFETLEVAMSDWVKNNSESLNESWRRCQQGKHPLKIAK